MVEWIAAAVAILLTMVLLPWLLSFLPRARGGGGVGNALQEIDALFNPGAPRHVEARQHPVKPSPPKADPPDEDVSPVVRGGRKMAPRETSARPAHGSRD